MCNQMLRNIVRRQVAMSNRFDGLNDKLGNLEGLECRVEALEKAEPAEAVVVKEVEKVVKVAKEPVVVQAP